MTAKILATQPNVENRETYRTSSLFLSDYPWGWRYGYGINWSTIPFRPFF